MSGIISGIHSIKHIRYMRYKSKKVHVIDSFIGNKVHKLYFFFQFSYEWRHVYIYAWQYRSSMHDDKVLLASMCIYTAI